MAAAKLIPPQKISFLAKLHMISIVLGSVGYFIWALFFQRSRKGFVLSGASSLYVRNLFMRSSGAQLQWFLPSTDRTYKTFSGFAKFKPETITFEDGSMGHWMGDKKAKQTILYLHGGGFFVPATLAHMKWLWDTRNALTKAGTETSVFILTYQLAPERGYPCQLQQAVNFVRHAIEAEGISPSQIILGGDSAGGNLTLAVLSHIMHPHPEVPRLELREPFKGTLLISPWILFSYEEPVPKQYSRDMLSGPALAKPSGAYLGSAPSDSYNEPAHAPADWWAPLNEVTRSIFVWCGGNEMLRPSIEKITAAITSESMQVTLHVVPGATHVSTIVDVIMPGSKGVDPKVLAWFESLGTQTIPEKLV